MASFNKQGYDPNTMFSAAYDWRLSYINLEERGNFTEFLQLMDFCRPLLHETEGLLLLRYTTLRQIEFY